LRIAQLISLSLALTVSGCALLAPQPEPDPGPDPMVLQMASQIDQLNQELLQLDLQLRHIHGQQEQLIHRVDLSNDGTDLVLARIETLPEDLRALCPTSAPQSPFQCPPQQIQRVLMQDNKMVVGERERIWLQPPGLSLTARIDSSTPSNALLVDALTEFERDGEQWVRFRVRRPQNGDQNGDTADNGEAVTSSNVERPILRHLRAQSGSGPRRPVVSLAVRIGDVDNNFEFMLTDRAASDHQAVLGRNFLNGLALVDVSQQFIQPPFRPRTSSLPDAP
jgi:hypothetical protein